MTPIKNCLITTGIILLYSLICFTCLPSTYDDEAIANAIYRAEGSEKAVKPYGILAVKCYEEKDCRQICLNTIRNQRVRHKAHECELTYLECLARRYCPVGASDDPQGLNANWLSNVWYFLKRG